MRHRLIDDVATLRAHVVAEIDKHEYQMNLVFEGVREHPELAFEEHYAARTLSHVLNEAGFNVQKPYCGLETAFRAELGEPAAKAVGSVALLVQYDALPELGHACGHHVIASGIIGAALALAPIVSKLGGRLAVIGCPAEEEGGGKVILAEKGAFAGFDAALMFHAYRRTSVFNGFLAMTAFEVQIDGRPAHASTAPERGVNALEILLGGHAVVNGMRPSFGRRCRLNFIVSQGGVAGNLVPARARGTYFINNSTADAAFETAEKIKRLFEGIGAVAGATVSFHDQVPYQNVLNNQALGEALIKNLDFLGIPIDAPAAEFDGYTDVGNVSYQAPVIYPMLGLAADVTPHTLEFADVTAGARGRRIARAGAALMALTALDVLSDDALRDRVRTEFQKAVAGDE